LGIEFRKNPILDYTLNNVIDYTTDGNPSQYLQRK